MRSAAVETNGGCEPNGNSDWTIHGLMDDGLGDDYPWSFHDGVALAMLAALVVVSTPHQRLAWALLLARHRRCRGIRAVVARTFERACGFMCSSQTSANCRFLRPGVKQ
jgi:hypothetical protein